MTRNLLSEASSVKVYSPIGVFANGDTMTIEVYKDGSSTAESLTTGTLTEIGSLGVFYWEFSDLVDAPTEYSEYYWLMSDSTTKESSGVEIFGGWTELLNSLPQAMDDADICRITLDMSDVDGESPIEIADLYSETASNYIELKTTYYADSRYFKLGVHKPSYDQSLGHAYWKMPQGSTVDVKVDLIGVSQTNIDIPSQSTISLYDLLNP